MSDNHQIFTRNQNTSIGNLFRCSDTLDYILFTIGLTLAFAEGVALPFFSVFWGNLADSLINQSDTIDRARDVLLKFIYLGIGVFFTGWGSYACLMITGFRQSIQCRKLYLQKLIRQQIAWFDTRNQEQMSVKFSIDCLTYQRAIGENFFHTAMIIGMTVSGTVIAFIYGWLLTLVIYAALPFLGYVYYLFGRTTANKSKIEEEAFTQVGGKTEEIISSIQTVKMLNGQDYQMNNFSIILDRAKEKITSFIKWMAFYVGLTHMLLICTLTLGYWFGTECVSGSGKCLNSYIEGTAYSPGNAIIIVFILVFPALNLSQLIFSFEKLAQGKAAAARIFEVIDRVPLVQSAPNAIVPAEFRGVFRFQNVSFAYPSSSERVLAGLNLEIAAKSTAVVGESGCGKSTIFQLMMRFYDPSEGRVTLDGVDLRALSLEWLRRQIGYVGQEPVLFAMSVRDNLLLASPAATEEEVVAALREAEAYDFVCSMKDGLDSFVGNAGDLISGGQKQRIAIARALVKKPKILLLDEATSSLDLVNEALIQDTLAKISENIKTVTIAHRKATIKSNEELYYIEDGKVLLKGIYEDFNNIIQKKNFELPMIHSVSNVSSPTKKTSNVFMRNNSMQLAPNSLQQLSIIDQQSPQQIKDSALWETIYQYLQGNYLYLILAMLVTIINGITFPLFAIFLSKILVIWVQYNPYDPGTAVSQVNLYSIYGLAISIAGLILTFIQKIVFYKIGLQISSTMRRNAFQKVIRMPLSWFQAEENSSGRLSASIDSDCNSINKFTSSILMSILKLISGIVFGVVLAFVYQWRTALVSLGLLPLIGISGFVQQSFVAGLKSQMQKLYQSSANIINETVKNIRTVASLAAEQQMEKRYEQKNSMDHENIIKKSIISGVFFGISYMMMYVIIGLIIYLGINFKINNNLNTGDVFCAIYLISFSGLTSAVSIMYFPDVSAAKTSLRRLTWLLRLKEEKHIVQQQEGNDITIKGNIEFNKVSFKYEGSPFYVLDNVSFQIKAGQKVGVVGHSGCGKSTIIKLIQGFYQPTSGSIRIDGVKLTRYNTHQLRLSIGIVNQQPVLFNDTVLNNIVYNRPGEAKDVLRIIQKSSFTPLSQLSDDPTSNDWLHAQVGVKGSHLSGGQKQRIAILRMLYRKPEVFLLDQATSALDQTNEKMALNSILKRASKKTVINVTHRLSCLSNFDRILVFKNGELVEQGTFQDLMDRDNQFKSLMRQSRKIIE